RPDLAVDEHGVAEEFGNPDRRHARIRIPGGLRRIEQRPVAIEEAVLDDEGNLVFTARQAEGILVLIAQQIKPAAQTGIVVQSRDAERVIVIPERGRLLIVWI